MEFDNKWYVGTGTIINASRKNSKMYILTCAHNCIDVNEYTKKQNKATQIQFKFNGKTVTSKQITVYPAYLKKKISNDIAVIEYDYKFDDNEFVPKGIQLSNFKKNTKCLMIGYPGEKTDGKLYGMEGDTTTYEATQCLAYNIDTTGGNSGSPLFNFGRIIGVHTNGDYLDRNENYGVHLTKEKLMWIVQHAGYVLTKVTKSNAIKNNKDILKAKSEDDIKKQNYLLTDDL